MKPQPLCRVVVLLLAFCCVGAWTDSRAWAQSGTCVGDCNEDGEVTVNELVAGVNIALERTTVDTCPDFDASGDARVTIAELVAGVNNAMTGCGSQANLPPQASELSFIADPSTPYVEKQLIGSDPDGDTITYELIADGTGIGYDFAYLNPHSGVLYLALAADFQGSIVLPYHVTDGKLFSNTAAATLEVQADTPSGNTGSNSIDPHEYAGYPRAFYDGARLGAPGAAPTLPSSVDVSKDFPLPGNQGNQYSCVGWAIGYALKSYQERVEIGWSLEPTNHRFSPAYIYNQINGGVDTGSRYVDALNLVINQGVATLAQMPYDDRDFLSQPSAAARAEASNFKARSWKIANGILEIKDALANHIPVVVALEVYGDLERLKGPDSVYNTFNLEYQGGHAVLIGGYDDDRYGGAFKIINSWGQQFGDAGYFWLPYAVANQSVNTRNGFAPVLHYAFILEDMQNTNDPTPDPVDPRPVGELPDLQVTNWTANYNGSPGGSGSLQYTVTNTGTATAPLGAYVALVLSHDPTFTSGNSLVVYEPIPFTMAPGTTAFRDANNAIAFNFPSDLEPGQYYMAVWADIWNNVEESNDDDNISPATTLIDIVNTLPDIEVTSWYSQWDELGLGTLTYEVINNGASVAPAGWRLALALSPNDFFGDGDESILFAEPANFDVYPGGTLYRRDSGAASFSLYFDQFGNEVPDGYYYIALWLDSNGSLAESNEFNNVSVSWGTIGIGVAGLGADASAQSATTSGAAYNGKRLPARPGAVRRVRVSRTPQGGKRMEFVGEGASAGDESDANGEETPRWSKIARARQQVIFPVTEMKPMPAGN